MRRERGAQLVRALSIVRALRRGPQTVERLAEDFGVHRRTIYRDLIALQEAHVPLMHERYDDEYTYWRLGKFDL